MDDRAKRRIAETARYLNDEKEDIGARRLRSVLSFLFEEYLFGAPDLISGRARLTGRKASDKLAMLVERGGEEGYIL